MRAWEATAPCALLLGRRVAVALDRRAWCRIETRPEGLELEFKDVPQRIVATALADLAPGVGLDWILPLLRAAGVDAGLRIAIHGRVPAGTGLGVRSAQAVAVAAALDSSLGTRAQADGLARLILGSTAGVTSCPGVSELAVWTALLGGGVSVPRAGGPARRIALDPGKLEERLLLVDVGLSATPAVSTERASAWADDGLVRALEMGAWDDVGPLLDVELAESLPRESVACQVAEHARSLGGRAWMCVAGSAGLLGVWISPDGRRALLDWMRTSAAGARPVASRLDLLGCEAESA